MRDLLTIKEAAFKLGTTSAELRKLIRTNQVPFIEMPNGIRFDTDDLTNLIETRKKGRNMTATAEKTERQAMQEHLRNRPKYVDSLKLVNTKLAEIQAKVDTGELTKMALVPLSREWDRLSTLINDIDNSFRTILTNNCPNEDLHEEWLELSERRSRANEERVNDKRELERIDLNIESLKANLESLMNPGKLATDEYRPFTNDAEYQSRIDKQERKLNSALRSKERCELRVKDVTGVINHLTNEMLRVKEERIYFEEDEI